MFGLWLSGARAKSEEIEGQAETQGEIITRHRHWGKHQPYLAKCHPQTVRNCPLKRERDTFIEVKCSFSYWHHDREWMLVWPGWDAPSHPSPSIAYSLLIVIANIHENPGHAGFQGNCDQTSFVQCTSFYLTNSMCPFIPRLTLLSWFKIFFLKKRDLNDLNDHWWLHSWV